MDIGELLSYKPSQTPQSKRSYDEDGNVSQSPYKSRRVALSNHRLEEQLHISIRNIHPDEKAITDEERQEILKFVETEQTKGEVIDENALKRIVLNFEKRCLRNREMRTKFPDAPEKFMESEIEVHEMLVEMRVLATAPDLYPLLVRLRVVPSLLELMAHDNSDICVATIELIHELTDLDTVQESGGGSGSDGEGVGADSLIEALLDHQIISLLVAALERLDETVPEEADGVHQAFGILESLTELRPSVCDEAVKQGLLPYLLRRLKMKANFHPNKLYASELLAILLQEHTGNRQALGDLDGIDALLQQLAYYKRHEPSAVEERELMENLFGVLCSSLLYAPNRETFLRGEGLQLMNLMLRERRSSRAGALKVLDYAMAGSAGRDCCAKFVDILGLRTIFPLLMKTPRGRHSGPAGGRTRNLPADQHEEHVASIIASMLRNCRGAQRHRLLSKFTENDHEKVDRLLELHFKYLDKVESNDERTQASEDTRGDTRTTGDTDDNDDEIYLRRLDTGLFTLQLVDYIILEICAAAAATVKKRVTQILSLRGASLKTIRHVMREYAGNLGDGTGGAEDREWKDAEQQHILHLVDKF